MSIFLEELQKYQKQINPLIEEYLKGKLSQVGEFGGDIEKTMEALLKVSRGGKRFRGFLMYLGYLVAGGKNKEQIVHASMFAEIFHLGLMVQDDVMDKDDKRRGESTVHNALKPRDYGNAMAMMVGDLTFAWAMEILLSSGFEQALVMGAMGEYRRYFERVVYGQMMDVGGANSERELNLDEILRILQMKTAEYTGVMPFVMGARLAGLEEEISIDRYKEYAINLGWAFQIMDDVLSIYGQEEIGKPVGSDLREKKQTLLVMHFREHASNEQLGEFRHVWGKQEIDATDVEMVRKLMKDSGSYDYVVALGNDYVERGKLLVNSLTSDSDYRKILADMIGYMMERVV